MELEACIFLDRNAVSMVKAINLDPLKTYPDDARKELLRQQLKALDVEGNFVSALLSIIEGEKGRPDTPEEKRACVVKETAAVAKFFTKARTDQGFLIKNSDLIAKIFTDPEAHGQLVGKRTQFLERVVADLLQRKKPAERAVKQAEMFELAKQLELRPGDPIVVLSVAALHWGVAARQFLKPKELNVYNVLGDLDALCYRACARAMFPLVFAKHPAPPRFEIFTGDKGLAGVDDQIELTAEFKGKDGEVAFAVVYRTDLFGELPQAEAEKLNDWIYSIQ